MKNDERVGVGRNRRPHEIENGIATAKKIGQSPTRIEVKRIEAKRIEAKRIETKRIEAKRIETKKIVATKIDKNETDRDPDPDLANVAKIERPTNRANTDATKTAAMNLKLKSRPKRSNHFLWRSCWLRKRPKKKPRPSRNS
jgi:hypothetical protein